MDELNAFKLFLIQEQKGKKRLRSARTVELHLSLLKRLKAECPSLTPEEVTAFLMSLYDKGRKGTYLNDYIDTLNVFDRYKGTTHFSTLKYFPEDRYEKAVMSDKEIEDFLALPPPTMTRIDHRTGKKLEMQSGKERWKVKTIFWKILAYTGMRPGEVAHLKVTDVDFGRQVFLADGKTGPRLVPIPTHLVGELSAYIVQLKTDNLFPARSGGMSRQNGVINDVAWGYDFHERIKRLGIKRNNLTPYSLRHSLITRLLNEDVNLYKVQNLVGHKQGSPVTSQYYHLTTKALHQTIKSDTLSRSRMTYDERFMQFRNSVRQLLSDLAKDTTEEKKMLEELLRSAHLLLFSLPLLSLLLRDTSIIELLPLYL